MIRSRFIVAAAGLVAAAAMVFTGAGTASAAPVASSSAETLSAHPLVAAASTASGRVHIDSAAGAVYYVCVEPSGNTLTVLYHQSVKAQCRGAAAIQLWYESGQHIKTIPLTTSGKKGTHYTANPGDCAAAVVGSAVLVIQPELNWVWYTSAAVAGYSLKACISQ